MFWDTLAQFVTVVGKISAGNAQAKASAFNARITRYNANETRKTGRIEEERIRREGRRRAGLIRANVGASGFELSGSAADLLAESVYNSEYDALTTRYSYEARATGQNMQAALYDQQGKDARSAGYLGAASSLLTNKAFTESGAVDFKLGGASKKNTTTLSNGETITWN